MTSARAGPRRRTTMTGSRAGPGQRRRPVPGPRSEEASENGGSPRRPKGADDCRCPGRPEDDDNAGNPGLHNEASGNVGNSGPIGLTMTTGNRAGPRRRTKRQAPRLARGDEPRRGPRPDQGDG